MTKNQRLPYLAVLFGCAASGVVNGALLAKDGNHWTVFVPPLAIAVFLTIAGVTLALHRPPLAVPFWSRPYEILRSAHGVVVRCTRCDDLVLVGSAAPLPMPRVLTYMHSHSGSDQCLKRQRDRAHAARLSGAGEPKSDG